MKVIVITRKSIFPQTTKETLLPLNPPLCQCFHLFSSLKNVGLRVVEPTPTNNIQILIEFSECKTTSDLCDKYLIDMSMMSRLNCEQKRTVNEQKRAKEPKGWLNE